MTNKHFDEFLKFLDNAAQNTKKKAAGQIDLGQKVAFYANLKKIEEARRTIIMMRFGFEDYIKTGQYSPPERIETHKIEIEVPKQEYGILQREAGVVPHH